MKNQLSKKLLSLALACAVVISAGSPLTLPAEALTAREVLTFTPSTEGSDVDTDITLYGTIASNPAMYVYECGYTVFAPETQFTVSNTSPDSSAYAYIYYYSYTKCEESTIDTVTPESGDCSGLTIIDFVDYSKDETADWRGTLYTVDFQGQYLGSDSTARILTDGSFWDDPTLASYDNSIPAGDGLVWDEYVACHRAFVNDVLWMPPVGTQQLYPGDSVTFTLPDDGKDTIYVLFTTIYYPEEDMTYRAWYNIKLGEVTEEEQPDDSGPIESTPPDDDPTETTPPDDDPSETTPPDEDPSETTPPDEDPSETTPPDDAPSETTPPDEDPSETDPPVIAPPENVPTIPFFPPVDENTSSAPADIPFADISEDDWYYDAVEYVYTNGLMTGTSATTFDPNATTTRGMIVTILYRLEGTPAVSGNSGFNDVGAGTWYADAVQWAVNVGIINGYGNGSFGPEDDITREQLAVILHRYAEYKGYNVSASANLSSYTDAGQISDWALEEMMWANAAGLLTGRTATSINPGDTSIRAEFATILYRFCENIAK